jgi:hypothetical protein
MPQTEILYTSMNRSCRYLKTEVDHKKKAHIILKPVGRVSEGF